LFGNPGATAGSLFGGPPTTGSLFGAPPSDGTLFGSGFKIQPTSNLFGGGSLFGSLSSTPAATTSNLFSGAPAGGSLFGQTTSIFGGSNSLFSKPEDKKKEEGDEGEDDDDNTGKGGNSPPSYNAEASFEARPVNLKIESRPPEKSPYTKIYNKYVEKFKVTAPEPDKKTMGNGNITLEVAESKGKKVFIIVYRNQIGKTLYQGTVST
jgi:hypothetical protein